MVGKTTVGFVAALLACLLMSCGPGSEGDPDAATPGQDAGPDASDAQLDTSEPDPELTCGPAELPTITAVVVTPSELTRAQLDSGGAEVTVSVETRCFTPPIEQVSVITRDPRTTLGSVDDPEPGEPALVTVNPELLAMAVGEDESIALGVRVRTGAEVVSQDRAVTLIITQE